MGVQGHIMVLFGAQQLLDTFALLGASDFLVIYLLFDIFHRFNLIEFAMGQQRGALVVSCTL